MTPEASLVFQPVPAHYPPPKGRRFMDVYYGGHRQSRPAAFHDSMIGRDIPALFVGEAMILVGDEIHVMSEADAREFSRRTALGFWGRLREDLFGRKT